jgi:hypothetical protein
MHSTFYNYILKNRRFLLFLGACLFLSLLLTLLSRSFPGFSQWYGKTIFPVFVNTVGRFFALLPFSVFELMICATVFGLLLYIAGTIYLILKRKPHMKKRLAVTLRRGICILASLLLVFTLTASINYSRPPISAGTDTSIREYTRGELLGLSLLLVDEITELAGSVPFDEQGLLLLEEVELGVTAAEAMRGLEDRYPSLSGYYPAPKPILFSKAMSYLGITGIFSPFTLEANYNRNVAPFLIPYTICHELAHLKGFMREDEAGFLAYLACKNSQSTEFQYSGTLNALLYTLNQLYSNADSSLYDAVYLSIPERVRTELAYSRNYWKSHTGAVTSIAKTANDKYLMVNAQTEGTKSYGRMVDLLLKEYSHRILTEYGDRITEALLDNLEPAALNL